MTPFGRKVRAMREDRGISLKEMAAALELSPAYLSALEHGRRGKPSRAHVYRVCAYFNIIWDEAEELERLASVSHPRVTVDTAGLGAEATELANRLAQSIRKLPRDKIEKLLAELRDV